MMLERQKRLPFLPEMQSKVTAKCNNSIGTEYKHGVLVGDGLKHDEKAIYNAQNIVKNVV